jgi:hypothetical protein
MERYGELDGEIIYLYATAFAQVNQTLTAEQQTALVTLRTDLLGDLSYPAGAFLYSERISMPVIPNTDFLFSGTVIGSYTTYLPLVVSGATSSVSDFTIEPFATVNQSQIDVYKAELPRINR